VVSAGRGVLYEGVGRSSHGCQLVRVGRPARQRESAPVRTHSWALIFVDNGAVNHRPFDALAEPEEAARRAHLMCPGPNVARGGAEGAQIHQTTSMVILTCQGGSRKEIKRHASAGCR
jgi:hypothetical protein